MRPSTIIGGYVAGGDKINRRTVVQRSFSFEHDNSTVCFHHYNVTVFSSVESELRTDGDSKLSTLAIALFFYPLLRIYDFAYADFRVDRLGKSGSIVHPFDS